MLVKIPLLKIRLEILFPLFVFASYCTSCSLIRTSKNKSSIKFAQKKADLIKECATFAISVTLDSKTTSFTLENIKDKKIKRKIASLGNAISVAYFNGGNYEITDSIVTFKTTSLLMGVTEFIYDFASNPRNFSNSGSRISEYYFVKVADRIYYRKCPFPMM